MPVSLAKSAEFNTFEAETRYFERLFEAFYGRKDVPTFSWSLYKSRTIPTPRQKNIAENEVIFASSSGLPLSFYVFVWLCQAKRALRDIARARFCVDIGTLLRAVSGVKAEDERGGARADRGDTTGNSGCLGDDSGDEAAFSLSDVRLPPTCLPRCV